MKAFLPFLIKCIFLLCYIHSAVAYEIRTHEAITEEVINISEADLSDVAALGNFDEEQLFPNPAIMNRLLDDCPLPKIDKCSYLGEKTLGTFKEMLLNGSSYEDLDTAMRPLNHFYNPVGDYGIWGNSIGMKNPDWAMETNFYSGAPVQEFSYPDAYNYFYTALTEENTEAEPKKRDINFGKMFQSLGQVLHLLQDMAAIEHVRNDAHLASPYFEEFIDSILKQRSRFELYTEKLVKDQKPLPFKGHYPSASAVNFSKARDYWVTNPTNAANGIGLSEFTNTNFFSQDTIYLEVNQEGVPVTAGMF